MSSTILRTLLFILILAIDIFRGFSAAFIRYAAATVEELLGVKLEILTLLFSGVNSLLPVGQDIFITIFVGILYYFFIISYVSNIFDKRLTEHITGDVTKWAFRITISLHVLFGYLSVFLLATLDEIPSFLALNSQYGLAYAFWAWIFIVVYMGAIIPVSTSYFLSKSFGGWSSNPDPKSFTFQFMDKNPSKSLYDDKAFSTKGYWFSVGLTYGFVFVFFGISIYLLQQTSPLAEILLIISMIAKSDRIVSQAPNKFRQLDIEDRASEILKFATYNFKALVHSFYIISGLIATLIITNGVLQSRTVLRRSVGVLDALLFWLTQWGIVVSAILFCISSLAFWIALSNRIPHFIYIWSKRSDMLDARATTPASTVPPQSPVDTKIPILLVIASTTLPFAGNEIYNWIYNLVWPFGIYLFYHDPLYEIRGTTNPLEDGYTTSIYVSIFFLLIMLIPGWIRTPDPNLLFLPDWFVALGIISGPLLIFTLYYTTDYYDTFDIDPNRLFKNPTGSPAEKKSGWIQRMREYTLLVLIVTAVTSIFSGSINIGGVLLSSWFLIALLALYIADPKYYDKEVISPLSKQIISYGWIAVGMIIILWNYNVI